MSVDDILRGLGVSPAVLYQHFDSKEALYKAVLNEISAKRESYVDAILTGDDAFGTVLSHIMRIHADSVATDPDYLRKEMQVVLERAAAAK